jgi:DNA polymerase-3 subunit delta'
VLLKILEEPPGRTAIVLITPYRDRLFPTLVSRCQPVRFRPLSDEEMRQCLAQLSVDPDSQLRLLELARGSPGRALHMSRQEQIQATVEAETLWQDLAARGPAGAVARWEGRGQKVTRPEMEERVKRLRVPAQRALHDDEPGAAEAIRAIQAALQQLRQNVQPALVYDYLLLQLTRRLVP